MDWMENTGILNQVNQHASTNSQATPNNRNYDTWSLNSTDTTKQPLDKILGVKESLQPEANNPPLCHVCAPCFVFSYIIVLFMGVLGYGLVIFVCDPEQIGSFVFFSLLFGLEGFILFLICLLSLYIYIGNVIKYLSNDKLLSNNPSIAKFMAKHMRMRSDGFTTSLDTFLIVAQNTYTISTTRYTMTFSKLLLLGDDIVWYISVQPKLPKELSAKQANLFTINVD